MSINPEEIEEIEESFFSPPLPMTRLGVVVVVVVLCCCCYFCCFCL